MASIEFLRHQICLAIGSLEAEGDDVESKLKPLLDQAAAQLLRTSPADAKGSSSLSPLLVASDKGHVASLLCLSQYDTAIVGGPLDASQEENGENKNTPVHHAAMAGCSEAWEIFADMMLLVVSNNSQTRQSKESIVHTLASVTNAHGDTPLQMAVPVGHLEFLQKWYTLATTTESCGNTREVVNEQKKQTIIQTILQMTNQAGDTCASLACCHGHVHLVDFLLNTCHVSISHDEITTCQKTVQRMDQALQTAVIKDPIALASFRTRQAHVHDCLNKLQVVVSQQANDAANELLLLVGADNDTVASSTIGTTTSSHNIACSFKKNKTKKKGNKGNSQKPDINSSKNAQKASQLAASANSGSGSHQEEPFHVTRLSDGRVAVSVPGENVFTDMTGNNIYDESWPFLSSATSTTACTVPPAEILLRHRFRRRRRSEGDINDSSHHEHDDIDAVMDALCLDVSMLLYTPHGMALNLSPSQLDAVQQILEMQIRSVQQARNLQQCRMMHQPTTTAIAAMTTTAIELMNQETAPTTTN